MYKHTATTRRAMKRSNAKTAKITVNAIYGIIEVFLAIVTVMERQSETLIIHT